MFSNCVQHSVWSIELEKFELQSTQAASGLGNQTQLNLNPIKYVPTPNAQCDDSNDLIILIGTSSFDIKITSNPESISYSIFQKTVRHQRDPNINGLQRQFH